MIKCQICKREFKSTVTATHLKTHNVTTKVYIEKYGENSLSTDEYRENKRKAVSGKNNPMYGKKISKETKQLLSEKRRGRILSKETKNKISKANKKYWKNNPEKALERHKKSMDTKIERYGFGSFPTVWKGRKHTEETKRKLSLICNFRKANKYRSKALDEKRQNYIIEANLTLLNDIRETVLELKCNNCDVEFTFTSQYFTDSKFKTEICPKCFPRNISRSKGENEIFEFVKGLFSNTIANDRFLINPLEIDIYVPELKIGFEYCGLYWHCEETGKSNGRPKAFNLHKQNLAKDKGIRIYTIYEDEWLYNQEIVKSRIKNILNYTNGVTKYYARECLVKEINSKEANKFLKENHLQGTGRSNVRYGLYYANELVSVMTFLEGDISKATTDWEINRFCSKLNHNIVGGASKLFKHFLRDNNDIEKIISYADSRWSDGNLYKTLGFDFSHQTPPNYWYFRPQECIRKHRYSFRKNKNDDPNLTEYENRLLEGYQRVWDCGSTAWIYENE